jgi:hypothetical protein
MIFAILFADFSQGDYYSMSYCVLRALDFVLANQIYQSLTRISLILFIIPSDVLTTDERRRGHETDRLFDFGISFEFM